MYVVTIDAIGLFNGKLAGTYQTFDDKIIFDKVDTTLDKIIDESIRRNKEIGFIVFCTPGSCDFIDEAERIINGRPHQGMYIIFNEPNTIITEGLNSTKGKIEESLILPKDTIVEILFHTHPLREGPETYHSDQDREFATYIFAKNLERGILTLSIVLGRNEGKALIPTVKFDEIGWYKSTDVPQVRSLQLALIYNCFQKVFNSPKRLGYEGYVPEPRKCYEVSYEEIPVKYLFREPYLSYINMYKKLPPIFLQRT